MMPPNGAKSIANDMAKLIVEKVDDIIWEIQSRRRSDSNELPGFIKEDTDQLPSYQGDVGGRIVGLM